MATVQLLVTAIRMLFFKSVYTFSVRSSAPLIIVVSSCVSSPPLPALDGQENEVKGDWKEYKILENLSWWN